MSTYSLSAADLATIAAAHAAYIAADPTWTDDDGFLAVSTSIGDVQVWRDGDVWIHGVRIVDRTPDETEPARKVSAREADAESFTLLDVIHVMQCHRAHATDGTLSQAHYRWARGLLAVPLNLP